MIICWLEAISQFCIRESGRNLLQSMFSRRSCVLLLQDKDQTEDPKAKGKIIG